VEAPALSIMMPVYDEAATAEQALREVLDADLGVPFDVVVVDDGSRDGSGAILERVASENPDRVTLLVHETNRGKGAAIRTEM
jgi:dolichol-phosphate hexosyltransferase